jgi:hypothetical protein
VRTIARILVRGLLGLLTLLFVTYIGDYASLRLQIPKRPQTQDIQVQPLIAVPEKNHKTEYMLGDQQAQTCVNSLFPQMGYQPCWYVSRHTRPQVNI